MKKEREGIKGREKNKKEKTKEKVIKRKRTDELMMIR